MTNGRREDGKNERLRGSRGYEGEGEIWEEG